MGSPFRIIIESPDSTKAALAADSAFAYIAYLNSIMSDYLDGSEINRLSASSGSGKWVKVTPELFEVVRLSVQISQLTNGYFDITVGPAIQEWRRAMRRNYFPTAKTLRQKRHAIGYKAIDLDTNTQSIRLRKTKMKLDLGGIGKGYAAEKASLLLSQLGYKSAIVDAGGDLSIGNKPTSKQGWEISINSGTNSDSIQTIQLANKGIATSGANYRFIEHKGKKYSHIVNPRTGIGLRHHLRTTVIAPSATQADALSTAVSIAGIRKSKKMLKKFPDVQVWLLEEKEGKITSYKSIQAP